MTVCTLATGISSLLRECADHGRTVKEISQASSQIQNISLHLKTIRIDRPVLDSFRSMGDVLKRTKEHIIVWKYKRILRIPSLLDPSNTLGQLKRDIEQLNQQLALLSTSLAYSHSQSTSSVGSKSESESTVVAGDTRRSATVLGLVENKDVIEFWRGYVGEKV